MTGIANYGNLRFVRLNPTALRVIRERSGLTISALAVEAELSQPHLSNIESGKRKAGPDVIVRLAKALKAPVTAIICDPDELEAVA